MYSGQFLGTMRRRRVRNGSNPLILLQDSVEFLPNTVIYLNEWVARIARLTNLVKTESFASGVPVQGGVRSHSVDIAPEALERIILVIGSAATGNIDPFNGLHSEMRNVGEIPFALYTLLKRGIFSTRYLQILLQQELHCRDFRRGFGNTDLLM